jgi:hypothetical protein
MHRRSPWWVIAAALLLAACHSEDPKSVAEHTSARAPHQKPRAPVELRLETRFLGGTSYDVTLIATPSNDVRALALTLDGRTTLMGDTPAGEPRSITQRVTLGQLRGREIIGSADVGMGGHRRRAAATTKVGVVETAAPLPVRIVRLPDGSEVAEVRP